MFHVYLSPEHAGNSTATLASWGVDDMERDAKVVYFKDPDGNTLSIAQAPRF
jgi:hypothetical protein